MQTKAAGRRPRRRFTSELKAGAVRLVLDEGKTIGAVARELDLVPSALGSWVLRVHADRTRAKTGLTSEERAELVRRRKENRGLAWKGLGETNNAENNWTRAKEIEPTFRPTQ